MSRYNQYTTDADISVKLVERDEGNDKSIWVVTTTTPIDFIAPSGLLRTVPEDSEFKFEGEFDATEDEATCYVKARGLLDACGVSDADFEYHYLD